MKNTGKKRGTTPTKGTKMKMPAGYKLAKFRGKM